MKVIMVKLRTKGPTEEHVEQPAEENVNQPNLKKRMWEEGKQEAKEGQRTKDDL
jgi:hypothetical protein